MVTNNTDSTFPSYQIKGVRETLSYILQLLVNLDPEGLKDLGGKQLFRPIGCPNCLETGYAGRTGIHEFLLIDDSVRTEIMKGSDASLIRKVAIEQGMTSLREDAAIKVINGVTTIEEVLRVTQENA